MNEIARRADAKVARSGNGVSVELITAIQGKFARHEAWFVSANLRDCLNAQGDFGFSKSRLRETLAEGEAMLGNEQFQWLIAGLQSSCVPATLTEIRRELGMLFLAFPTKDDLSAFVEIAIAEIASEPVSRLRLAAACRELRRTARFRPTIAEILEALADVSLNHVADLLKLPERVQAVRQRFATENCIGRAAVRSGENDSGCADDDQEEIR